MIEVELRAFIDKEKYNKLLEKFKDYNIAAKKQITYYFSGDQDFRLMITSENLMLWLKTGEIHDEAREEASVNIDRQYKDDLLRMLHLLAYQEGIKWYRIRNELFYKDIYLTIDYTHGYGYIFEAEIKVNDEALITDAKGKLQALFKELEIEVTDKQVFKDKYNDYKINWLKYTKDIDENNFLND